MPFLLGYTRKPIDNIYYDARLAYSLHLAISKDGKKYTPLNHNSGILFAKATENEDGSLNPKTIKNPVIFADSIDFGIAAIRFGGDGEDDPESENKAFLYKTKDFLTYTDALEISLESYSRFQIATKNTQSDLTKAATGIEGAEPCNIIQISDEIYNHLMKKLGERINTEIRLPSDIKVHSKDELAKIKATAVYNDGTTSTKKIEWDYSSVDFTNPGKQVARGTVLQQHFAFPMAYDRADPCMCKWGNKYYFIATNDADQNHTLYIREADSIPELVNTPETLLLDSETYEGIGGLLWAPEFHEINGRLYIFHAATPGEFYWEESHIMCLREGGNPTCREDWSAPKRICKADGSELCKAGNEITLDMTCFLWEGEYYVIWSQRQFLPKDLGAWLYIAKLNPNEPWKLATEPVVLSKPDYGWANNHTFVDEGPFALIRGDKLFITFSSAAVDTSYVVGLLQITKEKDLLVRSNWEKTGYPLLTSRSMPGEFGTGHNAYVYDDDGEIWNTYHARPGVDAPRSSGVRRVHFDIDGEPVLDLIEEKDLCAELKNVEVEIEIIR